MNILELFDEGLAEQHDRFARTVNAQLVKVLRTIGFDKQYVKARGAYLYDREGTEYLDCLAGYGVFNMGRNHPVIKDALKSALDADLPNMVQMDAPNLAGVLAEKLLAKIAVPAIDTIFFTNSGTEAVEGALKFAKCATKRARILYCVQAFHGLSNGALSCNGNAEFRTGFEPLLPACDAVRFGDLESLENALRAGDVAAWIVEPIQGKGVFTAAPEYFDAAIRLCRTYGTLVIADEVQTGFGRTGKWFACHHWSEQPDIVCVAKALSGGFIPIGAIAYPKKIYDAVFSSMDRCMVHSNTFGRNTLAMTAGLAALEVLESERLIENAAARGAAILDGLREKATRFEMIKDVRGQGLMIGIEFGKPKSLKLRAAWELVHALNKELFGQLIVVPLLTNHRVLSQVAGHNAIVRILPPLCVSDRDVAWILDAFEHVLTECHKFPGSAWDVGKDLAKRALKAG